MSTAALRCGLWESLLAIGDFVLSCLLSQQISVTFDTLYQYFVNLATICGPRFQSESFITADLDLLLSSFKLGHGSPLS